MRFPFLLALVALFAAGCGSDGGTADDDAATSDDTVAGDADGAAQDAVDTIPPLEPISKLTFALEGVPNTFDDDARVIFAEADQILKITATERNRKIEINLFPVTARAVGNWNFNEPSEVNVLICYHDGSGAQQLSQCPIGFSHESIAYDVTISSNEGPGEFVEGTFSATLQDAQGTTLEITDGVIDAKYR